MISKELNTFKYEIYKQNCAVNKNILFTDKQSMNNYKKEILDKICYTELVYGRINKKLNIDISKDKIEEMISTMISETNESEFQKRGKNIYITNNKRNVRLTINAYTNRIITIDKLDKKIIFTF